MNIELTIDGVRYTVTPSGSSVPVEDLGETKPCPGHPGKTLYHKSGKYGPFWSHKNDEGGFHNIKG